MAVAAPRRRRLLHLLLILAVVLISSLLDVAVAEGHFVPYVIGHSCSATDDYKRDSQYQVNLLSVFSDLRSGAVNNSGFQDGSAGEPPDKVFGLTMCYADRNWTQCKNCLYSAAAVIQQACPLSREAKSFYGACVLRYSNESFFSVADLTIVFLGDHSGLYAAAANETSSSSSNNNTLLKLMTRLTTEAAHSPLRFSNGSLPHTDSQLVYGLAQCTRDLNASECTHCLSDYTSRLSPIVNNYTSAGGILGYSCYVRYHLGVAFDIMLPPAPAQLPSSPRPPPLPPPPPP